MLKKILTVIPLIILFSLIFLWCNLIFCEFLDSTDMIPAPETNNTFRLSDSYYDENEKELFKNTDKINSIKNFYSELENSELGDYVLNIGQALSLHYDDKSDIEKMRYAYEEGRMDDAYDNDFDNYVRVKHLVVNQNSCDKFGIYVSEGRVFEESDYLFKGLDSKIPVLLGKKYKNIFSIGDTIEISYYTMKFDAEVVGFVTRGISITESGSGVEIPLDRYIITPAFVFTDEPKTDDEKFFQAAVTLDNINGTVYLNRGYNFYDLIELIDQCREKYDLERIYILDISSYVTGLISVTGGKNLPVFMLLTLVVIAGSIALFHFVFVHIIRNSKEEIRIKGKNKILIELFVVFCSIFVLSHLIAYGVTSFYGRNYITYNYIWVIFSFLFFISFFTQRFYLKKL